MDILPAFAMAQSAAPPMESLCEPSAVHNFGTVSHPAREQCWAADQPKFPGPSEAVGSNAQHEYDVDDFILNYGYAPASTNLTGSIFSQQYPTPPRTRELTSPERSPSNSDGRRRSSTQSDDQKRKPNHAERDPTKSSGRDSTKKTKAKEKAAAEVHENTKKRGSTNDAAVTNLSSPHFKNNANTRKVQERNRIASNKFRIRKQEDERKLKSAEKDMEQINRDLLTCATDLTLQVYNLKMKLLQHTDCDCALIQEYIANEAHRYIQDLGD
ncbi:hypothetical protein FOMG_19144 [Fusarium oxysporum f. sp. melonis 26406]|uniref:BZIP domain-containing protein n=1 Tax=Fusarium oxysporum f. sp. melonis 26406 TaxID=1089452 RepID=W9ZSQ0_FUSOX|nr:hypothetical protein FOMG_19144 [Fusarium oxysporum f. sp. melonis 26406]EXK24116.1 hypothetical protein FOMG_19144 [Fusarium oxysporum f. sp. melonis 26406]EXK24117.1 hypothetical protein FOMG_19144 [Fusarium oxysporum f. sp. melonis 26406]